MSNTREQFEKMSRANYFSRVERDHLLDLHIGLDDKGRKAIELRAKFNPRKINGTGAIYVAQYKKPEYNTVRFSLVDDEVSGLFYMFCDDLIEQTRNLSNKEEGYRTIVNRFYEWKRMFITAKNNLLTEAQIMGLIGEILEMRSAIAAQIGLTKALRSWSGQELTHKDFSYESTWVEVKTIKRSALTVKISSLEQLDSDTDGYLVVYAMEKMSAEYNGVSLNRLVMDTRNMFSTNDDRDAFMSKVALQGYEYNNYYDEFVYEISSRNTYLVNAEFPKLTQQDVPTAIRKASYEITLADIEINKIILEEG